MSCFTAHYRACINVGYRTLHSCYLFRASKQDIDEDYFDRMLPQWCSYLISLRIICFPFTSATGGSPWTVLTKPLQIVIQGNEWWILFYPVTTRSKYLNTIPINEKTSSNHRLPPRYYVKIVWNHQEGKNYAKPIIEPDGYEGYHILCGQTHVRGIAW